MKLAQAEEQIVAKRARRHHFIERPFVGETRTSTRLPSLAPIGLYSPVASVRSNMAWALAGKSPISSRKSVPVCACAKAPG